LGGSQVSVLDAATTYL
jgi:hypothetical protein